MPQYMRGWFTKIDSTFCTNDLVGGNGGEPFQVNLLKKGASLTEIRAWLNNDTLCGVAVTMSNDQREFFGFKSVNEKYFIMEEFEKITKLVIISDKKFDPNDTTTSYLRGISIETSKGRKWEIISNKLEQKTLEWDYPIGSGVCCGIFGYADRNFIYQIGFVMLKSVREALLKNVRYSNLDESTRNFPELISSCTYINSSASSEIHKMQATRTFSNLQTWGITQSLARILGFVVEGGYPRVFKIGGTCKFTNMSTEMHESSSTETESWEFEWSVTCSPKSKLVANAVLYTYDIEADYEGTMELHMESGKVFSYEEKGRFKGINRTHCELNCEETKLETKKVASTGKK